MQLDNRILQLNDVLFHLWLGECTVVNVTENAAVVRFTLDGQRMELNQSTIIGVRGTKVFGLGKPLTVWPLDIGTDMTRYSALMNAAILL